MTVLVQDAASESDASRVCQGSWNKLSEFISSCDHSSQLSCVGEKWDLAE